MKSNELINDDMIPSDLPKCMCFTTNKLFTMSRAADFANAARYVANAFHVVAGREQVCPSAMPYLLDIVLMSLLAYVAKCQGPALEYATEDIERETYRLLEGLEARVRARSVETYERGRKLELTEESMKEFIRSQKETQQ